MAVALERQRPMHGLREVGGLPDQSLPDQSQPAQI